MKLFLYILILFIVISLVYSFFDTQYFTNKQIIYPHSPDIYSNNIVSNPYKCVTPGKSFNECMIHTNDISKCMSCSHNRSYNQCIEEGYKTPSKCVEMMKKNDMMVYTPYIDI